MKTKVNPALVGVFVLGCVVLGLLALLSFGGVNFFSKPQRFVVYFDESIHGLDLGSPVKLRGVRVGRVVDLALNYDETKNEAVVAVTCELSHNVMKDAKGQMIDVSTREKLDKMIDHGLRAQLGVLGLATGLLFVELDFVEDAPPVEKTGDALAVVPATPSAISEFQASLTEILSGLKRVDFPGLSKELNGLLVDTRKQVNGLNLAELSANWSRAGQSVSALAESPEIMATFQQVQATLARVSQSLAVLDAQVAPAGAEWVATLAEAKDSFKAFGETAIEVRQFVAGQTGLSEEGTRALMQMAEAAAAIQRLADFLERNPNALLTGKKQPE